MYAEARKDPHKLIEGAFRVLLSHRVPLIRAMRPSLPAALRPIVYIITPFAPRNSYAYHSRDGDME